MGERAYFKTGKMIEGKEQVAMLTSKNLSPFRKSTRFPDEPKIYPEFGLIHDSTTDIVCNTCKNWPHILEKDAGSTCPHPVIIIDNPSGVMRTAKRKRMP